MVKSWVKERWNSRRVSINLKEGKKSWQLMGLWRQINGECVIEGKDIPETVEETVFS